ncbi:hypothetical protein MKW92_014393, partial [Papaver armeniacum]
MNVWCMSFLVALLLIISFTISGYGAVLSVKSPSKQTHLKVDGKLNKPSLKTIQTEYGDVIDCVDIYQQPSFDHPSPKNNTIQ